MSDKYRRDGTPYPPGDAGLFEWAKDLQNYDLKRVALEWTLYGERVSTVWMGLDHSFFDGPPLIFETMIFRRRRRERKFWDDFQLRYTTEEQALKGHFRTTLQCLVPPPLRKYFFEEWR